MRRTLLIWLCLTGHALSAPMHRHLVLIGGGLRPAAALARLVDWSGGPRARILVVAWATSEPEAAFTSLKADLAPWDPGALELAPTPPRGGTFDKARFLTQLRHASAVFFTGGDQRKIMAVLSDRELLGAIQEHYRAGVVMAGTSAGTAIMSQTMLTGEGDSTVISPSGAPTAPGLGLLPAGLVVDQHFLKRQRENRLFSLILVHPELVGIGIDEGTALLVTDGREAEVVGPTPVMVVDGRGVPNALVVRLEKPGSHFELSAP